MQEGSKVKLSTDLTRYHPSLVIGTEGTLESLYSPLGDRFATVRFAHGAMPILWQSIEPVNPTTEEKRRMIEREQAELMKQLSSRRLTTEAANAIGKRYTVLSEQLDALSA